MELKGIWTHYHSENSPLPQGMRIGNLTSGSDGRIWVEIAHIFTSVVKQVELYEGYTHGIMVYDQDKWYLLGLGEGGLPDSLGKVNLMTCDQAGRLWMYSTMISSKYSINCFDGNVTETFNPGERGLPSEISIFAFSYDKNGNFWTAMGQEGLYYFDGIRWQRFTIQDCQYLDGWISNVASDNIGRIWFSVQSANSTRFIWYDGKHCRLHSEVPIGYQTAMVQVLAIDKSNNLWVSWNSALDAIETGLWVLKSLGKDWNIYTHNNSALPDNQITGITFDKVGRAWVVSGSGLTIFDDEKSVNWGIIMPGILHSPIRQEDINVIIEDTEKQLTTIGVQVTADKKGRIWAISYEGVSVFSET